MSFCLILLNSCEDKVVGCATESACNFNPLATEPLPESCILPKENFDCFEKCVKDQDKNFICDFILGKDFKEGSLIEVLDGTISYEGSDSIKIKTLRHDFFQDVFEEKEGLSFYRVDRFPGDDSVAKEVNAYLEQISSDDITVVKPFSRTQISEAVRAVTLEGDSVVYSPIDDGEFSLYQIGETILRVERIDDSVVFAMGESFFSLDIGYVVKADSDKPHEIVIDEKTTLVVYLGGLTILSGDLVCDSKNLKCQKEKKQTLGCTNTKACNYDKMAALDDGYCELPDQYYDCSETCLEDSDQDGVCDQLEIKGCLDSKACNYNLEVTDHQESKCQYKKFWYSDKKDSDSLGDKSRKKESCEQPDGYVLDNSDANPDCHSDITDVCGVCEGSGYLIVYRDEDGDKLGNPDEASELCSLEEGYVLNDDDTCPFDASNDNDKDGHCGCTLDDCTEVDIYDYCDDDSEEQGDKWFLDRDGDEAGDIDADPLRVCSDPSGDGDSYVTNQNDNCPNNISLQTANSVNTDFDEIEDCDELCVYDAFNDIDNDGLCYCTMLDCSLVGSYDDCPNDILLESDSDSDSDGLPDCIDTCPSGYGFSSASQVLKAPFSSVERKTKELNRYFLKLNPSFFKRSKPKISSNILLTSSKGLNLFFQKNSIKDLKLLTKVSENNLSYVFTSSESEKKLFSDLESLNEVLWFEKARELKAFSVSYPPNDYVTDRDGEGGGDWNLGKILLDNSDASDAWDLSTGEDVVVAVLDTGVSHNGVDGVYSLLEGIDFIDYDRFPEDEEKHGTHVAGIIAQKANNSKGRSGVAPESSILPVRVLDGNGSGTTETVSEGIYWAVNYGADVINLSLGFSNSEADFFSQVLSDAVDYAEENGVVLVASVGNDGFSNTIAYPAAFDSVLAVGAIDKANLLASYSNQGEEIDLVAPGGDNLVEETYNGIVQESIFDCSFAYYSMEGTSQAAPHVSGTVALILASAEDNSINLSMDDVRKIVKDTALDLGDVGFDHSFGFGLVQAKEALDYLISGSYESFKISKLEPFKIIESSLSMLSEHRGILKIKTNLPTTVFSDLPHFSSSSLYKKHHEIPVFISEKQEGSFKVWVKTKDTKDKILVRNQEFSSVANL